MKRNFGLDLLRAISIWFVLFQHAGINIPGMAPLKIGMVGVEIFFVLSGFLIGGILFKEIDKKQNLWKTLKSFWVRRWFRILPLYYAVLFFKFIVIDNSIGWNILYYVFFLQNNFYGISFMDVSWSLVIEEWFYLFSPIFLFFVTKWMKTNKKIIFSIIAFIATVVLLRTAYVINGNVPYGGINGNFPFRFDSLFIGVLLSFFNYKKMAFFEKLTSLRVFLLGLALFVGYLFYFKSVASPVYLVDTILFPRTLGFFILPFSVGLMVPWVSRIKFNREANKLNAGLGSFITWTSVLTYAIYLIHPFVYGKLLHSSWSSNFGLKFGIAITATYLVSWLVYFGFEKPILRYRDKVTLKRPKS